MDNKINSSQLPLDEWYANTAPNEKKTQLYTFFGEKTDDWLVNHKKESLKAFRALKGDQNDELCNRIASALNLSSLDKKVCQDEIQDAINEWNRTHKALIKPNFTQKAKQAYNENNPYLAYHFLAQVPFPDLDLKKPLLKTAYLAASANLPLVFDILLEINETLTPEDLVEAADINDGFSPLHLACRAGSVEAFNQLVKLGGKPLVTRGKYGIMALELAIDQPHILIAAVKSGISPDTKLWGQPMLAYTFTPPDKFLRKFLIEKGADIARLNDKVENKVGFLPDRLQIEVKKLTLPNNGPEEFYDPITMGLMTDPVKVLDRVYDRPSILKIIQEKGLCPFTRIPIQNGHIEELPELKTRITNYLLEL